MRLTCPHCQHSLDSQELPAAGTTVCPACGSALGGPRDPLSTISLAQQLGALGRFKLRRELGAGAFGSVYEAFDSQLDRVVALKVPRDGLASGNVEQRFLREARSAAQLRHPGIVPIYEVGQAGELVFLVSEYVAGVNLADYLSGQALSVRESAAIAAALADALQHAHSQGIVHRDVKPSNIMLEHTASSGSSESGTDSINARLPRTTAGTPLVPRIMDFGLAKRDLGEVTMTQEGQVLGTPAYMSPEQARGDSHHVDGRSDVYSLGAVLYQMLTGELVFRGNQRMLLHQVLHDDPRSPRSLNDRVPRDLETICLKALAKEPARRYASAGEMGNDLRCYLRGEPIRARPIWAIERARRWCQRHPAVAALSGLLLLLLLGTSVGASIAAGRFYRLAELERNARQNAQDREQGEREARIAATEVGQQLRRKSEQLTAKSQELGATSERLRQELSRQFVANGSRSIEQEALGEAMLWYVQALELDQGDADRAAMHQLRLANLWRQMPRIVMLPHGAPLATMDVSPDEGRAVTAAFNVGTALLWDLETGEQIGKPLQHTGHVLQAIFSPDGKQVATAGSDGNVRVWDAFTGEPLSPVLEHAISVFALDFSADGNSLATGCGFIFTHTVPPRGVTLNDGKSELKTPRAGKPYVAVWDWRAGTHVALPTESGRSVRFSHDDQWVVAPGADVHNRAEVIVCDAKTGELIKGPFLIGNKPKDSPHLLEFTPDKQFVCVKPRGNGEATQWWNLETGNREAPPPDAPPPFTPRPLTRLTFSSNYSNSALVVDRLSVSRGIATTGPALSTAACWHPSGQRFCVVSDDRMVRQWDAATGRLFGLPMRHYTNVIHADYSPDGRWLATACYDGSVRIWDAESCRLTEPVLQHPHPLYAVQFDPQGKYLVGVCSVEPGFGGRDAHVWDFSTRRKLWSTGTADTFTELSFHPRQEWLAVRNVERCAVYELATGKPLVAKFNGGYVSSDLTLFDTEQVAIAGRDGLVRLHNLPDPEPSFTLDHAATGMLDLDYHAPGQALAVSDGNFLRIWNLSNRQPITPLIPKSGGQPRFRADGKAVFALDDRGVRTWDARTGESLSPLQKIADETHFRCYAVQPQGQAVLVGSWYSAVECREVGPAPRSLQHWRWLAQLHSGSRIDSTGAVSRLSQDERLAVWHEVRAHLRDTTLLTPEQKRAWFLHEAARRLRGGKLSAEVLSMLAAAEEAVPSDPEIGMLRASIALDSQKYVLAIGDLERVAPERPALWLDFARACQLTVDRLAPHQPLMREVLAQGITTITPFLEKTTDSPEAWLSRALLNNQLGAHAAAMSDADRALALDPSLAAAHAIRGDALAESSDWAAAAAAFERANSIELAHSLWAPKYEYALWATGDTPQVRQQLSNRPGKPNYLNRLVRLYHYSSLVAADASRFQVVRPGGDPHHALRNLQRAVGENRPKHLWHNTEAWAHYRLNAFQKSIDAAQAGVKLHGQGGEFYDWLVLALAEHRLGNTDAANMHWQQATTWANTPAAERKFSTGKPLQWQDRLEAEWLFAEAVKVFDKKE